MHLCMDKCSYVKISILVRYKMQIVGLFCNKNAPDEPATEQQYRQE